MSFTDDAGNEETLTSAATRRVAARPNTAVTGAPRNLKVTAGDGGELKVSWEGPASDSGSTITGYKVQWKSGAEEYDGTAASTRQAAVTGMASLSYIITGLTNDVAHTVRVIAINSQGDGAPSAGVTGTPLSKNAQLHAWIEKDIVEKHEGDHPWLRTTWEYMNEPGFELVAIIHNKFAGRVFVRHFVSSEHGLEGTKAYRMEIEIRYLPHSKGLMPEQVAIHEMAHVYTLTNDLSATPAPLGIAHVYFERMEGIVSSCVSREIYASMTTIDVLGPISTSYWRKCRGTNDDGNIDSLTQEALSVVGSALSGRMPQWFADTYNDSEGNTDLETLWADVKATGDNYRPTVVYRLRNAFGGYCDNEKIARYAHDGYNGVERNPWRDGGCVPKTPGKLAATAGDGELVLSWEAPAYDGGSPIESYRVQWKSGSEGYDSSRQAVVTDLGSLSHTITGLTNGAAYMVRIVAYNHNGDGEVAEVTATPTPNRHATGAPTIGGTAQVGETLTAGTSEVADSDGLDNAAFSYQWIRNDGSIDEDIQDATASTYTLVADDQGKTVRVRVSFTDDRGNDETLTSAATAAGAEPTDRPHGLAATASLDTIILTWKDADNDPGLDLYQILRHRPELGEPEPLVYVEYTQSSSPTFTDTEVEPGVLYVYRVKAVVDPFGYLGEASGAAEIRMAENNTLANGAPNITGTAQVGETLTADTSGIADSDGLDNATFRYQWVSNDGTTDTDIEDAASSTYTPVATDEGETIKVRVSFTDDGGNAETLTSEATAVVEAALTAELQGVPDSHNGSGTFTFRILFSEPVNVGYATLKEHSFQVSNATIKRAQRVDGRNDLRKFTIQPASDAGVVLVLPTTADCANQGAICTNDGKRLSTRLEIAVQGPAPANSEATGMPTVSGTAQVGETLTASASGVSDADGLDNATFSYQWIRNDGSTKADIQDATESTYTLVAGDEGKTIKVRVSFTDDAGNEETLTSAATAEVAARPNTPATGAPTISGTAQVGETLTVDTSDIADSDGLVNATYAYQWLADDTDIVGATGSGYTLAADDEGKTVKVRVSFTDDAGNEETLTSAATAAAAGAPSEPLTASLENTPKNHDGETPFTFELRFSEEFELSYQTLRDHAFTVEGGMVKKAQGMDKPSNIHWRITVEPDSSATVTVVLPVTTDCNATGAICTENGRMLSNRLELTVSGPGQ